MPLNPKVDDYINSKAEFAQPILTKLRGLVHQAHPEIEETIKWGMPNFEYKGLLFNMAGFKAHCTFGIWKEKLIKGLGDKEQGMGTFGKIRTLEDLPPEDEILMYLKEAVELNEKGVKLPRKINQKKDLIVPDILQQALNDNPKAKEVFENFAYTHRKEYIEWVDEAKRDNTKEKRVNQTIEWLTEGKRRNWKYENC